MNTKRSHKIFSFIMLILILATVVASTGVAVYKVYEYKKEMKLQEAAYSALNQASEISSAA